LKKHTCFISLLLAISILLCFSVTIFAGGSDDPIPDPNAPAYTNYSDLWVSAGGSTYTSGYSSTTQNRTTCYMRLRWFKFSYCSECVMPSGNYIYSRLYTSSNTKASNNASFSGVTNPGNYNYSYLSGYGSSGQSYKLKTNSSYATTGYHAKFDWSANPHT